MAKTINIMTSSDANLLKYIAIQLQSIHENINDRPVNFFLLHGGIKDENLKKLYVQCDAYDNISFNDIEIEESEGFRLLTRLGGGWNDAAYYPLLAHRYLPENIDRIMYIDAGDTFAVSDPSPYYDADFQGNALTVTPIRFKVTPEGNLTLYSESDLSNKYLLPGILRGLMNSGSYVINLKMMRTLDFGINDYTGLALALSRVLGKEEHVYWGDQGLLSAAFTGQMNVFGFPEYKDLFYMPHNFCMWYFDTKSVKPAYEPTVIHFAGSEKPWSMKYNICATILNNNSEDNLKEPDILKPGQAEYYYMWHEYALKTDSLLKKIKVSY